MCRWHLGVEARPHHEQSPLVLSTCVAESLAWTGHSGLYLTPHPGAILDMIFLIARPPRKLEFLNICVPRACLCSTH